MLKFKQFNESFIDDLEKSLPKANEKHLVCNHCNEHYKAQEMKAEHCPKCGHLGNHFSEQIKHTNIINTRDKKRILVKIHGKWVWKMIPAHRINLTKKPKDINTTNTTLVFRTKK